MKLDIDNKYTIVGKDDGHLEALRYGKPWRDLCGDNLVRALACRTDNLQKALDLALHILSASEPSDSRAVSDEFVAMAAVSCGVDVSDSCMQVIEAGLLIEWKPCPTELVVIANPDDSGIDVGDTTSGNVHVSVFHGEERASIIIDPDHATRVAERLWDCAATGRAVQMENKPQDSIP